MSNRNPRPGAAAAALPSGGGLGWRFYGACREADPSLFFGAESEKPSDQQAREAEAKAVCAGCPVRRQCARYAVSRPEKWGVWGAMGEDERAAERVRYLRRRRRYAA